MFIFTSCSGEKREKIVIKTPKGRLLSLCHIFDADGNELVQDKDRDVRYTVLLNKYKPMIKKEKKPKDEEEVRIERYNLGPYRNSCLGILRLCPLFQSLLESPPSLRPEDGNGQGDRLHGGGAAQAGTL